MFECVHNMVYLEKSVSREESILNYWIKIYVCVCVYSLAVVTLSQKYTISARHGCYTVMCYSDVLYSDVFAVNNPV